MRNVGDRVFVTRDNYGMAAKIIEVRDNVAQPPSRYKVRQDDGQEFWAFDYEVSDG